MQQSTSSVQRAVQNGLGIARSNPVLTAALAIGAVAALGMSQYIGLTPIATAGILGIIAGLAFVILRLWTRRSKITSDPGSFSTGRVVIAVLCSTVVTMAGIQLVPYGRAHSNPPVTGEPQWASARTRELAVAACFSCHSNEVDYPSYASVAPISWMVQHHVEEGRAKLNFSEFTTHAGKADESVEVIEDGEMPPSYFTRFGLHPEANLSDAELQELVEGLRATPGLHDG